MNRVDISAENTDIPVWIGDIEDFILKILGILAIDGWEVSLLFCDDMFMQDLNWRYRGKDEPTDVLSFAIHADAALNDFSGAGSCATIAAGDIVISTDTLLRQAERFEVRKEEELSRLLIHGILHLYGMDHSTNSVADEPMLQKQEDILRQVMGDTVF